MPACPLKDFELELLVGRVAERLQQGAPKEELVAEIADSGWEQAEVAAFVEEVEQRTQELGHPPRGCRLLRDSAHLQLRTGLLFATAGALAAGLAIPLGDAREIMLAGAALTLYGALLVGHGVMRLRKYRE